MASGKKKDSIHRALINIVNSVQLNIDKKLFPAVYF